MMTAVRAAPIPALAVTTASAYVTHCLALQVGLSTDTQLKGRDGGGFQGRDLSGQGLWGGAGGPLVSAPASGDTRALGHLSWASQRRLR